MALGGGPRRLVRRHEQVAGQGRDPAAPSGPAAARAVHQPARAGGDRRGRRSGALSPGDTMLDVACGRGGYGLDIAARTGARLVRVDFSAEPVRQACEHAWRLGRTAGLPPRESRRDRPGRRLGRRRAMRGRDPVLPAARRRLLRATAGPWARRTCGADLLGGPSARAALRCSHSTTKGMRSLEILDLTRRVIATATAPLTLIR